MHKPDIWISAEEMINSDPFSLTVAGHAVGYFSVQIGPKGGTHWNDLDFTGAGATKYAIDDQTRIAIDISGMAGDKIRCIYYQTFQNSQAPTVDALSIHQRLAINAVTKRPSIDDTQPIPLPGLVKEPKRNDEPSSNDGRATCWWCGSKTRKAGGGIYDVCTNKECGK